MNDSALQNIITPKEIPNFDLADQLEGLFRKQSPKLIKQMNDGIVSQNVLQVKQAAHTLSSSCGYLGMWSMLKLCQQIQALCVTRFNPDLVFQEITVKVKELDSDFFKSSDGLKSLVRGRVNSLFK